MFTPTALRLTPTAPEPFENPTEFPLPAQFTDFLSNSSPTLKSYPEAISADTILLKIFPEQADKPTENFVKLLNYLSNLYKNVVNLTQFLGKLSNKEYHFLLGAAYSKKLRYAISGSKEVRNSVVEFVSQLTCYVSEDFPEFAEKMNEIHEISLHIGVLRSEMEEMGEFEDFDDVDPLVRLFAVCRCQGLKQEVVRSQEEGYEDLVGIKELNVKELKERCEQREKEEQRQKVVVQQKQVSAAPQIKPVTARAVTQNQPVEKKKKSFCSGQ